MLAHVFFWPGQTKDDRMGDMIIGLLMLSMSAILTLVGLVIVAASVWLKNPVGFWLIGLAVAAFPLLFWLLGILLELLVGHPVLLR
jgi:hypothetical protein